jgi:hypothetical protein
MSRRAAALLLVGWSLMVPPRSYRDGTALVGLERSAELNKWTIQKSFDSFGACEAERQNQLKSELLWYRQHLTTCPPGIGSSVASKPLAACSALLESLASRCVASDDPLLKKN